MIPLSVVIVGLIGFLVFLVAVARMWVCEFRNNRALEAKNVDLTRQLHAAINKERGV